jgi:hypothetical protein
VTQVSLSCAHTYERGARYRMPIHTVVGLLYTSVSVARKHGRVGLTKTAAWEDARQHWRRCTIEAKARGAGYG